MSAPSLPNFRKRGGLCLAFTLLTAAVANAVPGPLVIEPAGTGQYILEWFGKRLRPYQVVASENLLTWMDVSDSLLVGNDQPLGLLVSPAAPVPPRFFWRLREGAIRPGFDSDTLESGDDELVSENADIGFDLKFAGQTWDKVWVNNNGNITFASKYRSFHPTTLLSHTVPIVAAFWADVDTVGTPPGFSDSVVVSYGQGVVDGRLAFGVNWIDAGYYEQHYDKLNSFQLILIDRSTQSATGDFDVEFNYNQIRWETGDVSEYSGGPPATGGYGGEPPVVGICDGADLALQVSGSGQSLSFLDTIVTHNPQTGEYTDTGNPNYPASGNPGTGGLIYRMHASTVPGRLVFKARNGSYFLGLARAMIATPVWEPLANRFRLAGSANAPAGAQVTYQWSVVSGNAVVSPANQATSYATFLSGTVAVVKLVVEVNSNGIVAKTATRVTLVKP